MAGYQASPGFLVPGFGTGTMDAPPPVTHSQQHQHDPAAPLPRTVYVRYEEPSPPDTIESSNYTTDQFELPAAKRQRISGPSVTGLGRGPPPPRTALPALPDAPDMTGTSAAGRISKAAKTPKPTERARRKRTGCLTCRDRHISCDEEFIPECGNCRKSNRACERGTRFSFDHSLEVHQPPYLLPKTQDWAGALCHLFVVTTWLEPPAYKIKISGSELTSVQLISKMSPAL